MMQNNRVHRIEQNIFEPMSISVTPHHLLGSLRSPLFGTGITCPSCHSSKLVSLFQNALRNSRRRVKFCSERDLKASGGTLFKPGDLPFANFITAFFNSSQVILVSSSTIVIRCWISSSTVQSILRWLVYNRSK